MLEKEDEAAGMMDIALQESTYDYLVVSGCVPGKRRAVCTALLLSVITASFILVLSGFLISEFAVDNLKPLVDGDAGNELEFWRDGDGSGNGAIDSHTEEHRAWASWACEGMDWSFFASALDDYGTYTTPFASTPISKGRLFGIVALVLWSALIIKEFTMIVRFACLLLLPTCGGGQSACVVRDGRPTIEALPCWVKLAAGCMVVVRLAIIMVLGINGLKFLAYTENLKDFVLNSLALGFIFDLDEMVFATFVSPKHQQQLRDIGSVRVSAGPLLAAGDETHSEQISLCALVLIVAAAYFFYLDGFATQLREKAFCSVCGAWDEVKFPQCAH